MDIRAVKTQKAIKEAFMLLRSKKALEKITVKELCREAQINKSTFYSHFGDIYSLSDALEKETVACISHLELTELLFSGQDNSRLADRLEEGIKELIYLKYPEYREDREKNILLSFCIQGAHHAYLNNRCTDTETLVQTIEKIIKTLQPLY